MTPEAETRDLLTRIAEGSTDRVVLDRLERLLVENFFDTELYDEVGYALALFEPFGGEPGPYVYPDELRRLAREALAADDLLMHPSRDEK